MSNIDRHDLDAAIRHIDVPVPLILTGEEARSYKPRAGLFDAGLELLGLADDEVDHLRNSLSSDIAGVHALGVDVA